MLRSNLRPSKKHDTAAPAASNASAADDTSFSASATGQSQLGAGKAPRSFAAEFVDASPHAFEPKVLVPFEHKRGRVPRKIEVERRRRLYESQDVLDLLRIAGLSLESIAQRSNQTLPIEVFDDTSYDCRDPDEWMQIAQSAENPHGKYLPARGIRHVDGHFDMQRCRVVDWNEAWNQMRVLWGPASQPGVPDDSDWVPRLHVHLLAEDPVAFVQRLVTAEEQRRRATAWIKYRLCCDAMPTEGMEGIDKPVMERIRRLGMGIPQLSKAQFPDVDVRTDRLIEELTLEWRRTHNRILLEHRARADASLQKSVQQATGLAPEQIKLGPNVATGATAVQHAGGVAPLPQGGFSFEEMNKDFTFATYYTQPEVVKALTGVRNECMKVLNNSLFNLPKARQMPLAEFERLQHAAMADMQRYLKETWKDNICRVIRESFDSVGKGWLNIKERSQQIYEVSKLRKFFTTVKYMMEDTLFQLVYTSLQDFTEFFEEVSNFSVRVVDMTTVDNKWPGSDAPNAIEKQPLFTLELIEKDGAFSFSTAQAAFEQIIVGLFDSAIAVTNAIPQVEKFVMTQYFWNENDKGPFLETVKKEEERVCTLRERVRTCLRQSLAPLNDYIETYNELLDIVKLDKVEYITKFAEEEHSNEEMKEEIRKHIKAKKEVVKRIPYHVTVGNFVVDCHDFRYTMANKNQDLAKLVMDLICKMAKTKTTHIREEFAKIEKTLARKHANAEKLYETKTFIAQLPEKTAELAIKIEDMRVYYSILESFQYGLTDDDFKHKWEAIGWPRKLDLLLQEVNKNLEKEGEDLFDRMNKDMEEFGKDVDRLQRTVATFSKYTDAAIADKVAAEVKMHNIDIKKCIERARAFNADQRLFGVDVTDYRGVFDLEKEFKPFSDLWLTTYQWKDSFSKWNSDPFDKLDAEEVENVVNNGYKTMTQLAKTFKDKPAMLRIVEETRGDIERFRPSVPVISALLNPGMQERHWKKLSADLGRTVQPGETLNNLKDCEELVQFKETIVASCEVAAKEYQIEKSLKEMKQRWATKNFTIEKYKATGTYLLKDSNEITEILDEHINITQQLQFSHFKAYFAEQIDAWEQDLNLISEILEQWLECQRSWRYLEPIFNSEDIAVQLPRLSKLFEKVDRTWRKIMGNAFQTPNVLNFCIGSTKILDQFIDCNKNLEIVQKGLNDYLQDKRQSFPRFYFLSDEELLEILSQSKDPRNVDKHVKKLFEFIHRMKWADNNDMLGFYSAENEYIPHVKPLTPKGNVENWLKDLETMMKDSVHAQTKLTVEDYAVTPRAKWVLRWPGQCVIAVANVFWTSVCEDELAKKGTVKDYTQLLYKQLMDLVDVVQSPLSSTDRINMGALITIEVHAKDTIDNMLRDNVTDARSFDWIKQLRFYFEEDGFCHIRQVDAHFVYGGEYLGNTGRLVVTPLTDRIYLTLTGALALCLGGAPAGPAGTGKTETTKDLAKALAKQCVVFNCQEGMTFKSMGKFFKGLAWSGAWACFDEFNRIDIEVLSVVAQQVVDLQQACLTKQFRIDNFEGSEVVVDPTYAIFITMNPGYAGRTELPDNLKVLFRPVACMVPDYALIGEIRLFSYGYKKARNLAQKMVMTFKLSSEQLSSQDHYDFGMRAVNTVISAAGNNKREKPNEDEDILLLRALRDSNIPKFLRDDIHLFEGIISDLFPGTKLPQVDYGVLQEALTKGVREKNYQPIDAFLVKCIQLFDVTVLRHGLMLVGPTGSGKTNAYRALQWAMTHIAARQAKGEYQDVRPFQKVFTHICNPKAITMDQLYGAYDINTGEWNDGILCILFRRAAYAEDQFAGGKQWVLFDGPVDALWIESMNTVLDENKKLCLVSGEIIQMSKDMTMMFEVEDLAVASPATVSRCGMIYMEPESCVPTWARIKTYMETMPAFYRTETETLTKLMTQYLDVMIDFVRRNLKEYVPSVDNNLVHSCFNMMTAYIEMFTPPMAPAGAQPVTPERQELIAKYVTPLFFMSLIWSVGATCDEVGREEFSVRLREEMTKNGHSDVLPEAETVYDYCFTFSANPEDEIEGHWVLWDETRPPFEMKQRLSYFDIIVPTRDTIRQNYVLKHLLTHNFCVSVNGPTGTGKSVAVTEMIMRDMPEKYQGLAFTFSAQTSANILQNSLMAKFDKRRSHVYGAPTGKHFVVFIDDTNLPQKEQYGAQPPIELLRQFLGHGGFYNYAPPIKWNQIIDISLVLAMGPPGGGRNAITNRFMRYFNYLSFPEMSDQSKTTIFGTILRRGFQINKASDELCNTLVPLIDATLSLFKKCAKVFVPTPSHVHYTFNMRDISRVFASIYESEVKVFKSRDVLVRMWVHENLRVFGDRLINNSDRNILRGFVSEELTAKLGYEKGIDEVVTAERLIFGDYMIANSERKIYDEIDNIDALQTRIEECLFNYNEESHAPMNLVMFLDAIEHVSRIARVLRMPNGHALLLGIGGSGRKSITRLATHISEMELFTVEITKNYGLKEWRESIAKLLLDCGKDARRFVFLFNDTQIIKPVFLEDVASLLTSGDVPNLFEDKDIEEINNQFKGVCISENLPTTKISMYSRFIKEVRRNLHIVLAFSPIGEIFRTRMRMFPSLVNCCTIDWFAEWPHEALMSVAHAEVEKHEHAFESEQLADIVSEIFTVLHMGATEVTEKFFHETRRRSYVTPTSYLSLLQTFFELLDEKRKFVTGQRVRLENGLEKLRVTEERVADLEEQLKAKQPILKQTQEEIKEMMAKLSVDREIAAERAGVARKEEAQAAVKADECAKMRKMCADRLAEAEPALAEAVKVLKTIKTKDIGELGNYKNPPAGVKYVMEAVSVMLMFGECPREFIVGPPGQKQADWWLVAKSKLRDPKGLLDTLTSDYKKESMDETLMEKIRPYIENPDFTPPKVRDVSVPCAGMCAWVHAMYTWFYVNKEVIPLREQLAKAEAELEVVNQALSETRAKLKAVEDAVAALQAQYETAVAKQKSLEEEVELTSKKLVRAGRLIDGLGGEKQRWIDLVAHYTALSGNIVGDTIMAAGSVAYFGPLTTAYRKQLRAQWEAAIRKMNIKMSEQNDLTATCGNPVEIQQWQLHGLPTDALSTENAIIMSKNRSWPLLIDPQGQANAFIRKRHENDNLQVCKVSDAGYSKIIEGAIRLGFPCLLENVGDQLDPLLDPILQKQTFMIGSQPHIKIGDSQVPYDANFRLYMTTKLPNPTYTPEDIVRVALLNFFITPSGLEDQLLGKTVEKERKDLEMQKQELTRSNAENNRVLKELQDAILRMLQEAEGDILENEELINTLEQSKEQSIAINNDLQRARETEVIIDETRNKYRPHAFRGSLLFFCVASIASIDPMYQFSLQWFLNLFLNGIDKAERFDDDLEARIKSLEEYFTYSFYSNVCRSLFEKHKLMFSFHLCTSIIREQGHIDEDEFRYFLAGPTSGGTAANPAPDWLTEPMWNEVQFVAHHLPKLNGFDEHLRENVAHYKALFDSNEAHEYPLAGEWDRKVTPLERLIVTRALRFDKVTHGIQNFVKQYMEEKYIIVPQFNLMDAYKDSTCTTPLIFIISPGSDPLSELLKFAEQMRMSKKLDKVSLGQGQGPKAAELIRDGMERGTWVLLQNCHLATSWMPALEQIVENFSPETIKKEFRLWLTSMPSSTFPVSVLQIGVKMTNEPPKGLRANLTRSYFGFKEDDLVHAKSDVYRKLLFAECLFHGVIQERRRFGSLGFNIPYEFNDSDRNVCILQLRKFLDMYDHAPFDVLTFLTGEINYGGRVTDDWDRRCMMTMIKDFLAPKALNNEYGFSPSGTYRTIEPGNRNYYLEHFATWPLNPAPEVFGLHDNADITSARNATTELLATVIATQVGGSSAGSHSRDELLMRTAGEIQAKLPPLFDIYEFSKRYPTRYEESMNTVLVQEAVRYNKLLKVMSVSLKEFMRAVKGEVVMSQELEAMGNSLFVNLVPAMWAKAAYPSLMPLSSWVEDLVRRVRFIDDWYQNGVPLVFWIGGFYFPQAFLTGTLQNYARQTQQAIDTIQFNYVMLKQRKDEIKDRVTKGAIIYGLFMEGARWDAERHSIVESRPKELYTEVPPIYLDPVVNRPPPANVYRCPVYKTLTRAGTLSTTGHSTNYVLCAEIPTDVDADHWIKRGVACLVSLNF